MSEHTQDKPLIPWPALVEYARHQQKSVLIECKSSGVVVVVVCVAGARFAGNSQSLQVAVERAFTWWRTGDPYSRIDPAAVAQAMAELAREMGYEVKE